MTPQGPTGARVLDPSALSPRSRYEILTSLVVPRPIGWISTYASDGTPNLAPYSYFCALGSTPSILVGASIGHRRGGRPKDTLVNIRDTGAFCVNVVTEPLLEPMNATSAEFEPEVDEFREVGLAVGEASTVRAPFVADCPAVLECRFFREVDLGVAPNTFVIGEVSAVRLGPGLETRPGTHVADPASLRPVGRLWGSAYTLLGEIRELPRPR